MRLSLLIRRVNHWFERVIHRRDEWDAFLEGLSGACNDLWTGLMVGCAQLGVRFSRLVLRILMWTGHALSASLSRQMEFDANPPEIRVAGSGAFEAVMVKLDVLGAVMRDARQDQLRRWRREFTPVDNLPGWVVHRARLMPGTRRTTLENQAGLVKLFPVEGARHAAPEAARAYEKLGGGDQFQFLEFTGRHEFDGWEAWDFLDRTGLF